jgi:translation initiation factor IF-3
MFKYQVFKMDYDLQEKEARLQKAHQHTVEIKGVRLSLRIGKHDMDIRKNQTLKFFNEGDKEKVELMMRGRELQQVPRAIEVVKNFIADVNLTVPIRYEEQPTRQANKIIAVIAKA